MRKFLILIFTIIPISYYAVSIEDITNSEEYYYGTGIAETYQEATDIALKELINQIAVVVKYSFESKLKETNFNIDESVESILKTHSSATLRNVQTLQKPKDGKIQVFHYIKKSEVNKIYEERKKLIYDMFLQAKDMEDNNNIGYALKYYYFSLILMSSLPDQIVNYDGINLTTIIPHCINNLLLNLDFIVTSDELISEKERKIKFEISYNQNPVPFLDFSFWNGSNQEQVTVRDGNASFILYGGSINFNSLKVNIKYCYYECRNENKILADLWNVVNKASFKNARTIELKKTKKIKNKRDISDIKINFTYNNNCPCIQEIENQTLNLLEIFQSKDENKIERFYSTDSFLKNKIKKILQFNKPSIIDNELNLKIFQTMSGWEIRGIGLMTNYPSVYKKSTEYLTLDFSERGDLLDINFSLNEYIFNDFVENEKDSSDQRNIQIILKFIEKYRTAFMSRDIETLNKIFAEEALIIVGRILKKAKKFNDSFKYEQIGSNQPDVEYLRFTKEEYIKRQKEIFDSQQDLFIDFSSFKIRKKNNINGVYGVSMRQYYNSTGYSDEGYLFLLVDFNEEFPQIYVRTWQPQEWGEEKLIKLSNYIVHKKSNNE